MLDDKIVAKEFREDERIKAFFEQFAAFMNKNKPLFEEDTDIPEVPSFIGSREQAAAIEPDAKGLYESFVEASFVAAEISAKSEWDLSARIQEINQVAITVNGMLISVGSEYRLEV